MKYTNHENPFPEAFVDRTWRQNSFPVKLHKNLHKIEMEGLASVISWQPNGHSFVIHDRHLFVGLILPIYFDGITYSSFQRQLKRFGFTLITNGRDRGGYFHSMFLRDVPSLSKHILRMGFQSNEVKGRGFPETPSVSQEN